MNEVKSVIGKVKQRKPKPLPAGAALTANEITAHLLIEIPRRFPGVICWRHNTGAGIGMSAVKVAIKFLRSGQVDRALGMLRRPITFGLVGSSDIVGVVGPHGRFIGLEVKDPETNDKQSPEQIAFELRINALGGVYIVASGVAQALDELGRRLGKMRGDA